VVLGYFVEAMRETAWELAIDREAGRPKPRLRNQGGRVVLTHVPFPILSSPGSPESVSRAHDARRLIGADFPAPNHSVYVLLRTTE
jgi:hypothetical protein